MKIFSGGFKIQHWERLRRDDGNVQNTSHSVIKSLTSWGFGVINYEVMKAGGRKKNIWTGKLYESEKRKGMFWEK